jgi:RES domain-containing protein
MLPPPDYASSKPITSTLRSQRFFRIYRQGRTSLGFGYGRTRFSDPRSPPQFGVAYFGASIEACFVEALIRDRRNGLNGPLLMTQTELDQFVCAEVQVVSDLVAIDLVGRNVVRNNVDTDVVGASDQTLARQWSVAFHEHPDNMDGVVYDSRLIGKICLAVYNRGLPRLKSGIEKPLLQWRRHMAHIIRTYQIAIVP